MKEWRQARMLCLTRAGAAKNRSDLAYNLKGETQGWLSWAHGSARRRQEAAQIFVKEISRLKLSDFVKGRQGKNRLREEH